MNGYWLIFELNLKKRMFCLSSQSFVNELNTVLDGRWREGVLESVCVKNAGCTYTDVYWFFYFCPVWPLKDFGVYFWSFRSSKLTDHIWGKKWFPYCCNHLQLQTTCYHDNTSGMSACRRKVTLWRFLFSFLSLRLKQSFFLEFLEKWQLL